MVGRNPDAQRTVVETVFSVFSDPNDKTSEGNISQYKSESLSQSEVSSRKGGF